MSNNTLLKIAITLVLALAVAAGLALLWRTSDRHARKLVSAATSRVIELKDGDVFALTAAPVSKQIGSHVFQMLAYNGSIPGPLLKIPQGAAITLEFANRTDMDGALHSHGVRMANAFDGTAGLTQAPIAAGGSFTYKLRFPDAGMYWYHPHVREDYTQELGLYGNYLVAPSDATYWAPVNREVALFLDDILIEDATIRLSKYRTDHLLMGRFGNVMLVNGESDYKLAVKKGEVIRFYITNAANARPFKFAIAGLKMKLVGADGGAYERDQWSDGVILGPSERAIIEVLFDTAGTFLIENKTPEKSYPLGMISVSDEAVAMSYSAAFPELRTHAATIASISPFRAAFQKSPDRTIVLAMGMRAGMMGGGMMSSDSMVSTTMPNGDVGDIEWDDDGSAMGNMPDMMQWQIVDRDTGKSNMDIAWRFRVGDQVKIRIVNPASGMHQMQHPIHFHGQRFLVLSENGRENDDLVWKDTVLVPAGATIDILLDASNPGKWMAHCHIAEHLEDGMMFTYSVE